MTTLRSAMAACGGATRGPWRVYEEKIPWEIEARSVGDQTLPPKSGEHEARRIVTEWDHPQSRSPHQVVCTAHGIGTKESGPVHFTHIDAEDAAAIVAAVNWMRSDAPKELLAENDRLRAALQNIVKHMEIAAPTLTPYSAVYRIATDALTPLPAGGG